MQNLIWDLDGTLIDSARDIIDTLEKAASLSGLDMNMAVYPFETGPALDDMLKKSFPANVLSKGVLEEVIKRFRYEYDNSELTHTVLFDGIKAIVQKRSFNHYIITNKPDIAANRILRKLSVAECFKRVITPYSFGDEKKNKEKLFDILIKSEMLDRMQTIGIGDMQGDCDAAHKAMIKAIGVLWGTGQEKDLHNCDYICHDTQELREIIESL